MLPVPPPGGPQQKGVEIEKKLSQRMTEMTDAAAAAATPVVAGAWWAGRVLAAVAAGGAAATAPACVEVSQKSQSEGWSTTGVVCVEGSMQCHWPVRGVGLTPAAAALAVSLDSPLVREADGLVVGAAWLASAAWPEAVAVAAAAEGVWWCQQLGGEWLICGRGCQSMEIEPGRLSWRCYRRPAWTLRGPPKC